MKLIPYKFWLLMALFILPAFAFAQTKTITGKVISRSTNTALNGVSVLVKGSTSGTQTNAQGAYTISATPQDVLVYSYTGYESTEQTVGQKTSIDVTLIEEVSKMDEVVIVGFGTQKRSKITGSVSTLDSKVLESGVRANPASALAGTIPGLRVQQTSGRPGALPNIVLRGGTNYSGGGSPLVVVDGIVRGSLSDINPNDIASIDVLKDASATAIYGARANNGVILISTKKGKSGVSNITIDSRVGINKLNIPFKFLNARDYLYWSRMAVQNSGVYDPGRLTLLTSSGPFGTGNKFLGADGNPIDGNEDPSGVWSTMILDNDNRIKLKDGWQTMIDPVYNDTLIFTNFDYVKHALKPSAPTQDYNVSMTGGNDKGKYYAGIGSFNELGFPINTFYNRVSFVLNGEYKIKPWLTSQSGLNYGRSKWRDEPISGEENFMTSAIQAPPTMRGKNENGDLLVGRDYRNGNPSVQDYKFIRKNQSDKFTFSQAFKIDFLKNFYLRASANWYYVETVKETFNKDFMRTPGNIDRARASSASFSRNFSQTYNAILQYNGELDKHHIDLMAGSEYYDIYSRGLSASGSGAPTDDFMDLGLTSTDEGKRNINSNHAQQRILSFFGRVTYDYDNRYLLTATLRRDGYSKLIDNRWGNFPGISIGWNISNESFFDNFKNTISYLKLRASYGVNGNVSGIGDYTLQGSYGNNRYNSSVGYLLSGLPFPNLLWERSKTYEFGLDATFINKIDLSLSVYNRKTDNKISSFTLPATAGFTSLTTNNGSMQNVGVEVDLNYRVLRTRDWRVDFSINGAYNANEILKLPNNGLPNNRQGGFQVYDPKSKQVIYVGGFQEGQDPNAAYAYEVEGLYRTDKDLQQDGNRVDLIGSKVLLGPDIYHSFTPSQQKKYYAIALGDVKWRDLDKNDTIDFRDRVYMGRTVPRTVGGFTANVSWKDFFVNARFDFALGYVQQDGPATAFLGMTQGTFNTTEEVKDTYTPTNTDAKYPTYYWADQLFKKNVVRGSSMFYHRGDYLAFREISVGYSIPEKWASKIKSQGVNITLTGQNLGYLSKSTLYSPESGSTSGAHGGYPLPRTFIFALKFIF